MNERVKELAKQSGIWFVTPREDLLNDFAELIIAESCVALHPMLRDMISRSRGVDLIVEHFRGES